MDVLPEDALLRERGDTLVELLTGMRQAALFYTYCHG
jgi:hypothetical protein